MTLREGDKVTTTDPHHGRRTGIIEDIWEGAYLFGPVVWVRYPNDALGHYPLSEIEREEVDNPSDRDAVPVSFSIARGK